MIDLNIKNDLTIVEAEYIKFSKKELLYYLQTLFIKNNFIIAKIEENKPIFNIDFENLDGSILKTSIIIKNITNAAVGLTNHILKGFKYLIYHINLKKIPKNV